MTRLQQIEARLVALRAELLALESGEVARAATLASATWSPEEVAASEAFSAADAARSGELIAEWDTLTAEREPLAARAAQLEVIRAAHLNPVNIIPGSGPTVVTRTQSDPFEVVQAVRSGTLNTGELVSRALDAVEGFAAGGARNHVNDASAQRMTQLVESNPSMAAHVLLAGSPTYHRAFQHLMQNQGEINALEPDEQASVRAALSLTGANGGYLIPVTLDPTIILSNAGSANPFRRLSTIKTITTNFWEGVTSAGVNAGWLAEGAVAPDATPTFVEPVITPQKAAAWVFGSYEVLGDTDFAQQFPMLLMDAKDRLEEAAFATGTGTGQPKGIVTAATTAVTTAAIATYAIADVYSLQAAIPPRFRSGSANLAAIANVSIINKTRQFDTAGGASYWTNLGAGQPETVIGMPLFESTTMAGTTTTGSKIVVAGDFSQYQIVDRVGMTVLYEPMVKDSATARPTGQAGWFAYWRVGADALVPNAFRLLTVQ